MGWEKLRGATRGWEGGTNGRFPGPAAGGDASVSAGGAASAPRPAPSGRCAPARPHGRYPGPGGGAEPGPGRSSRRGAASVPARSTPRTGRGPHELRPPRPQGLGAPSAPPARPPSRASHPGSSAQRQGNPPSSAGGVRGARGSPRLGHAARGGGDPFPRGVEGCLGLRWYLPSPPPPGSKSTPLAPPPSPPQTGRVQSSLPPPALAAPGAPRRATLRGRERAGGGGRVDKLGRLEVVGSPCRQRPWSPLPPAAAGVGDVARRGAAGV